MSVNLEYLNVEELVSEQKFTLQAGGDNDVIQEQGAFNLIKTVVTRPIFFIKFQIFSFFYAFLLPKPWAVEFITGSRYANVGNINFSGIAYWIHSLIWYVFDYFFILILLSIKKIKFKTIRFELISVFTLITVIPLLRHHEVRYLIMTIWPFFLILYYRTAHVINRNKINKQLAFLIWIAIVGYTVYLDVF